MPLLARRVGGATEAEVVGEAMPMPAEGGAGDGKGEAISANGDKNDVCHRFYRRIGPSCGLSDILLHEWQSA